MRFSGQKVSKSTEGENGAFPASFMGDQGGFIFTLDAAFAVIVTVLAIAGVASVGVPWSLYEQRGYLSLQRHANDALETLYNTGRVENDRLTLTMDNLRDLLAAGRVSEAESLAENELQKILPPEIQFRFRVGTENDPLLDNVYPTAGNHEAWRAAFDNAEEIGVATRVVIIGSENFEPVTLYVWRGSGI